MYVSEASGRKVVNRGLGDLWRVGAESGIVLISEDLRVMLMNGGFPGLFAGVKLL